MRKVDDGEEKKKRKEKKKKRKKRKKRKGDVELKVTYSYPMMTYIYLKKVTNN